MRIILAVFNLFLIAGSLGCVASTVPDELATSSLAHPLTGIDRILSAASKSTDPAAIKVAMDKLVDPSIDESEVLRQVDDLAANIRGQIPSGADADEKLRVLLRSLSTPGVWNDYKAFQYDLSDPMGRRLENKLLSTYLRTRRGNCVSMPILVLAVGRRIGLDMALSVAPEHVLVKFKTDGAWRNVETTSFGTKSDDSYLSELGISELAMQNRIYLKPLSDRESVAVIGEIILEHYKNIGDQEARLIVADKLLGYDPRNVQVMLHKGHAYFRMMKEEFLDRGYTSEAARHLVLRYRHLQSENIRWFEKAEALGWRQPSVEDDQKYLDSVNLKKSGVSKEQQQ